MSFESVTAALQSYEKILTDCGCAAVGRLRPGLSKDEAQRLAADYDITLTEDALAVWMWHDGDGTFARCPAFPPFHEMPTGIFSYDGFPSLRAALQVTERSVAGFEYLQLANCDAPDKVFVRNQQRGTFYTTHDIMRLWDVTLISDRDLPYAVIDCSDPTAVDSCVRIVSMSGDLDEEERTVEEYILWRAERLRRELHDGDIHVDDRGELVI